MGFWFWEIIYKTKDGNLHSLFSIGGFPTMGDAYSAYISLDEKINAKLKDLGCVLIVDEQIVFKNANELYKGGESV